MIFQEDFLTRPDGRRDARMVVENVQHVLKVAGKEVPAVGSDLDGAIVPPLDLSSGDRYPLLVHHLLEAGIEERVVRKILGENFLRALQHLRG